jgi:glucokinase
MNKNIALGVDIGGSHISCAAVDLLSGQVLRDTLTESAVDNRAKSDIILNVWTEVLSGVLSKLPENSVKGIGFAMPGPFDYVNGICYIKGVAKYESLYGINIADSISGRLNTPENYPVRFMNDASSFAVGEAWIGSFGKAVNSMAITLGTGFGSAFISNRIPVVDGPVVPRLGCVYHLPYKNGIADDYFSSRGLLGRYKKLSGSELNGVKELSELAGSDIKIVELFTDFGDELGLFLAPWLKSFKAEIVVIGGNISLAYNYFGNAFEKRLKIENCSCEVALSKLKEDAALAGSAYLLDDVFWKSVQHALPLM